ncbi:MAG: peptide chain release factor 2 [Candidatus Marinimicrobia bacterium]|jgi:peptide chain release factor 2|nr:peptide chain release factor 2 [Candidatus Neomarinimicrobiota bacterium]MBT3961892.1 peptide chain release factor 2 [Candidatus Neomarinimicrobiota bacterium]MBT4382720.1 peptide chain release factor 2 [Candidatus Neomarinimicrobiota bacterium]MBT4636660.1 peptide chain release factor 2 [Candidatus Neomarinimicrobiota bacterium]MBT4685345.1 peptide chain release factor 2 [Candidatus Neomarinimicrobiota bacterium]
MNCGGIFDLDASQKTLEALRETSAEPSFWDDNQKASIILKKISRIEKEINLWSDMERRHDDVEILFEFAEEGEADIEEIKTELFDYQNIVNDIELKMILGRKEDEQNAILTIHPGAGGTESQDWAEMLYRMYSRWIEKKGFKIEVLDVQPGDEAGIKDVTFEIKGDYAYGMTKAEAGVHRMVRISPFDSNSRRHTSFASVFVYPSVDDEIEIEINQQDLRIDTYRASGAGGQHVNKTDSAVRITHNPTGIVVQCQNQRSQHKNKNQAMKILKARIYQHELELEKEKNKELENQKMDIGWGSQIRSYVFHPYNMVKDHRTKEETGNVQAVMDGDIDPFIRAYLLSNMKLQNIKVD